MMVGKFQVMTTVNYTIQDTSSSDIELGPTVNVQDPSAHPRPATLLEQETSSLAACITACNESHEELQVQHLNFYNCRRGSSIHEKKKMSKFVSTSVHLLTTI